MAHNPQPGDRYRSTAFQSGQRVVVEITARDGDMVTVKAPNGVEIRIPVDHMQGWVKL